jgi:hypothetical protein
VAVIMNPRARGMKEHALMYAALGWRVFPVWEPIDMGEGGLVCSCQEGAACGRPAKHPRVRDGVNEATTDRVTIESWWTRWPSANIGISTGRSSNLVVVDADCSDGKPGVVNLTALAGPNGGLPTTPSVTTGSGGLHLYFLWNDRYKTAANVLGEAIDIRNDGGYVIAPPSKHKSGKLYEWRNEQADPIAMPDWMLNVVRAAPEEGAEKKKGRKRSQPGFKLDKLESMLGALDPDDRDTWLETGVIMGRLYVGTGLEHDAWAVFEAWASRSSKFDEDRAGNIARMREMYYERSQEAPRTGGKPLSIGTIIAKAKAAGWTPFGDRVVIPWEMGNEGSISEALVDALIARKENTYFNVMGEVRDVLKTEVPILRMKLAAYERGEKCPETLVVRRTTTHGLLHGLASSAVLEVVDKNGVPEAVAVPEKLGTIILKQLAPRFPTLTGIAEWPMVGAKGALISDHHGHDPATGLYFDIDPSIKIDDSLTAEAGCAWIFEELFADFPFEEDVDRAAALGLFIAFMQRPLMKTCPAFVTVAPQPGSGKSTLIELASIVVHGQPVASHAYAEDEDELRKAIHSLMLAKYPAVLFDNIGRGRTVDSDHLAKLLTSEVSTDRTLGASETRKEINTLLVTFTGNNVAFSHDMASRVLTIKLNARTANPLRRTFKHRDIRGWAQGQRNLALSALVAIVRAGLKATPLAGPSSRFEEFDQWIAQPVYAATGIDIRRSMDDAGEVDSEEDAELRGAIELIARWQNKWRKDQNGQPWKLSDLGSAVDGKLFDEAGMKILQRVSNLKTWEIDPAKAIAFTLRSLNGDHKFEPLLLTSRLDRHDKVNKWFIKGAEDGVAPPTEGF